MKRTIVIASLVVILSSCSAGQEKQPTLAPTANGSSQLQTTQPSMAPEPKLTLADRKQMANTFAFANQDGSQLIYPLIGQNVTTPLESFKKAIGENGQVYELAYVGEQKAGTSDSGRQTAENFANVHGIIFDVKNGPAKANQTYYLTKEEIIPVESLQTYSSEQTEVSDKQEIARIEAAKDRKVKQAWVIGSGASFKIEIVEFERVGDSMLASVVLVKKDNLAFHDFEAKYNEYSTWRVDDGGKMMPKLFHVMFVAKSAEGDVIGLAWAGAEAEDELLLFENGTKLDSLDEGASRYWSPM